MPQGMEDMFSSQNSTTRQTTPNRGQPSFVPAQGGGQVILLAASVVILAAGLIFAFKFKR